MNLPMQLNPSIPAKTVPEFIAYAKANPGKINMASSGNGALTQRVVQRDAAVERLAEIDISIQSSSHVRFRANRRLSRHH
jgi:tripartite-type tricarboxylate transporter receptor subunit TctC